ncbi:hypothetical protein CFBP4996_19735 [Agrobacterium leguminum]|uniref:Tail fiber domain-containing protein n=1 Tax=Agrobacterium deltaense NCPPB 1641 TaxID=1183425 RepID=A0A1S7TW27_9HYPH|nr:MULTISPECIES: hypothetical protein [Agrobacterium]WFS68248.1 hypothetical protein CFBP4996_19735 [Agrobacterium leguminum]CVI58774.1 conserved hypothetical protein [Agrobacterium deltaense NCPPB 1641]
MGFLSALTGSSTGKATMNAANQNKGLIKDLQTTGNTIINTGEGKSEGALNSAIDAYQPWVDSGSAANTMYGNALGLNGADGNAAATGAFQTGPGYQFALDQGTQAALRGASAAGMLNSGNTLTALTSYGQGLANQEYGGWLDRLSGMSSQGLSAAGGQASGYGALSDLYQSTAGDRLGLESSVTQGLMGVNNQWAQGKEAQNSAKGGFLKGLVSGGLKLATGGLF